MTFREAGAQTPCPLLDLEALQRSIVKIGAAAPALRLREGVRQPEQHPSGRWRALKLERGHIALKRKALTVACPKPTSDTSAFEKT